MGAPHVVRARRALPRAIRALSLAALDSLDSLEARDSHRALDSLYAAAP